MSRPLTPLALTVLRLLCDEPMHPYEMQQQIRIRSYDLAVKLTHGSLYNSVERLASAGLIEPLETSREGRRPERTVYAVTEAGRDAARDRLAELLSRPAAEFPLFGTALALIPLLPSSETLVHLRSRQVGLEALIAAEQTALDSLRKRGLQRHLLLDGELKIAQLRTELDYVSSLTDDLDSGRIAWEAGCPSTHPNDRDENGETTS